MQCDIMYVVFFIAYSLCTLVFRLLKKFYILTDRSLLYALISVKQWNCNNLAIKVSVRFVPIALLYIDYFYIRGRPEKTYTQNRDKLTPSSLVRADTP